MQSLLIKSNHIRRVFYVLCSTTVMVASLVNGTAAATVERENGTCENLTINVALNPGQPANRPVSGTLCTPTSWASGPRHVDVLLHGATYDRSYWDFAVDSPTYSYVNRTVEAGRAAFFYDRPGSGSSYKPAGLSLTITQDAFALHQIITWLRAHNHDEVNVVAHSFGTAVALEEAGTYHDVDRVVATGLLHLPNGVGLGLPVLVATLYPAPLDPQFIGTTLDVGYLTTLPGTRGVSFYSAQADPDVIAFDEQTKDVVSAGETATALTEYQAPPALNTSSDITAPVLLVMGANDSLFCGLLVDCTKPESILASEAPFFDSAESLSAVSEPGTGHDLTLHPSAGSSFEKINSWILTH